jgi:hypothetical protein
VQAPTKSRAAALTRLSQGHGKKQGKQQGLGFQVVSLLAAVFHGSYKIVESFYVSK